MEGPDTAPCAPGIISFVDRGGRTRATPCRFEEALAAIDDREARVWINFLEPDRAALCEVVLRLGFHELAVEDVYSPQSRPKVEEYPGNVFVVMPALNQNTTADLFDTINLNAFLGRNYLITVHRAPLPAVDALVREMEYGHTPLQRGPDFALYRLLDVIVDEYLPVTDHIGGLVDELQARIFERFDPSVSADIFEIKRQAALLRRRLIPQREIVNILTNRPHELVRQETQIYLRDVYDHVIRTADNLETQRDLLQGTLDSYLMQLSNRTNEVMKLLSTVATIFLPLNFLTGLYGTNFEILPGSTHPYGFWVFLSLLIAAALGAVLISRRHKWL